MELAALILSGVSLVLLLVLFVFILLNARKDGSAELRMELNNSLQAFGQTISENQRAAAESQDKRLSGMEQNNALDFERLRKSQEDRIHSLEQNNEQKLEAIRQTMERRLTAIQTDNAEQLEKMQKVVDEKLEKTLESRISESFKLVSSQLEQVYKGLGEMQAVAAGVTDLKKVLSNVKTRGILGETQLSAILSEILSPEQYECDIATKPGSSERVEFAIRLPGDGETPVYLPIDAKFPGETFASLQDAYDKGDPDAIAQAAKMLEIRLKAEAKDIRTKYIDPPHTTDFGILFLPFEGLYAEAVNRGYIEELQRTYHINVTGPSTMAAFLNSLQMGFRTLAIQKRSGEVWQVLGAVKTEFEKFGEVLERSQQRLQQVNTELDTLIGTRTRAITRKLKDVEKLDAFDSGNLLDS
ncbi:MAG: DNA recombination protein RmuC [Clostridia bacterium]|nr:DNA recombination protein RmuC [Clostridia bacterium]